MNIATSIGTIGDATALNGAMDALCSFNGNQRCITIFNGLSTNPAFANAGQACSSQSTASSGCSGACAGALSTAVNSLGCCFGSIIGAMPIAQRTSITTGLSFCGVTSAPACKAGSSVNAVVTLPNLNFDYYTKNAATLTTKIQKDIATAAGVSVNQVSVTVVADSTGKGCKITVQITASSDVDNKAAQSSLNTALTAGISFNSVAAATAGQDGATNNPAAPMQSGTDSQKASVTGVASGLQVSLYGMVAAVAAGLAAAQAL